MDKLLILSMAFVHLDSWLDQKKISHTQYLECVDDIKTTLNVSQDEYIDYINSRWTENSKSFLEVN